MNDIAAPILMVFVADSLGVRVDALEGRGKAPPEKELLKVD